jgi:DNA-binding response OmpR family regulator
MDFSMPEMNGYEAYLEIRKLSDSVEFVMVSGLQVTPEVGELCDSGEVAFLSKPFHEEELIAVINERLAR